MHGDFHMSMWTAIVLIVIVTSLARVAHSRDRMKHGLHHDRHRDRLLPTEAPDAQATAEMRRELEALRDRVKVLERIATEDRHSRQIAQEIEALRDK